MEFSTALVAAFGILLFILFRKWTKFSGYLQSLGIPLDTEVPWLKQNFMYLDHDVKCLNKFGHVWGRYDGVNPVLMVAEPELVKEIMVKKFDKFPNHSDFGVEEQHLTLFDARDEKWRALRKTMSPTFTSGKLKGMLQHMEKVANNMIECLNEKSQQTPNGIIDVKEVFQGLSLDTIANCAFGIETNSFKNPGNELFQRCLLAFSDLRVKNHMENFVMHLFQNFSFLKNLVDLYGKENYSYINKITKDILKSRTEKRTGDFIDRMKEMLEEVKKSGPGNVLNEDVILAQGIVFFIAGFETSSNTLSSLTYHLAKNPEVQDRIAQEVKSVRDEFNGRIDYETINQMPYLEAAINEALRLCPPVIRLDRICVEDATLGPYKIKKGTIINFPIYAMHHNPKYFPEPEKFKPERFLRTENEENMATQFAYIPFGGGPRQCIGMRFAIVEIKIAMAKLLANYKIVDTPQTKMDFLPGDFFILTYPEVKVKLEKRVF